MNSFNGIFGACLDTRIFSSWSLHKLSLRAAPRYRPIAFDPEGLSLVSKSRLTHRAQLQPLAPTVKQNFAQS